MQVRVYRVNIPAMSTIGTGYGKDVETGRDVTFGGDHRPMRDLGEAVSFAGSEDDLPVADVEDWQVLG